MSRRTKQKNSVKQLWIDAACTFLCEKGISSVQITRLAAYLKVSRGCFYWHFEHRQDLLDQLLIQWKQRNTLAILEAMESAEELSDGMIKLFAIWQQYKYFNPNLDRAIREWSKTCESVQVEVYEQDAQRVQAIQSLFMRCGFQMSEALVRARIIYFTQICYYDFNIDDAFEDRVSYVPHYYQCFTGEKMDSRSLGRFIHLISEPQNVVAS